VIGSVKPPFATPDLSSFIVQAQQSKAQVIGIAGGPPNNTNEIKLAQEFGLVQGGQQLAGLLILITDVHALASKPHKGFS
jgi:branched-chain amino acid transport system substrate-binding protein